MKSVGYFHPGYTKPAARRCLVGLGTVEQPSSFRVQPWSPEGPIPARFGLPRQRYGCLYTFTESRCELCDAPMGVDEIERRELFGVCLRCWLLPKRGRR
jgi:hypothetical protein